MDWGSIGKTIAKGAPMLGNLIGNFIPGASAVGNLAGGAVGMVCSVLGVDMNEPDAPEQISAAIQANPQAMLKLKEIETANEQHLREMTLKMMILQVEERKNELEGVKNARDREVEIRKAGGTNWPLYTLATVITVGFFGIGFGLLFKAIPESQNQVLYLFVGALIAAFAAVVQYFFGSSKGSGDKTKMLAQAQPIPIQQPGISFDPTKFLRYIEKMRE